MRRYSIESLVQRLPVHKMCCTFPGTCTTSRWGHRSRQKRACGRSAVAIALQTGAYHLYPLEALAPCWFLLRCPPPHGANMAHSHDALLGPLVGWRPSRFSNTTYQQLLKLSGDGVGPVRDVQIAEDKDQLAGGRSYGVRDSVQQMTVYICLRKKVHGQVRAAAADSFQLSIGVLFPSLLQLNLKAQRSDHHD